MTQSYLHNLSLSGNVNASYGSVTASTIATSGLTATGALSAGSIATGGLHATTVCISNPIKWANGAPVSTNPSLSSRGSLGIGCNALACNSTGYNNFAVGVGALKCNISGNNNIAIGNSAAENTNSGSYNIALGMCALSAVSGRCASNNIALGLRAGAYLTYNDSCNTIIGNYAGQAGLTGTVILAAGPAVRLKVNSTGLYVNGTLSGGATLDNNLNFLVGSCRSGLSGWCNIGIGYKALHCGVWDIRNIALGTCALYSNYCGYNNVALGYKALGHNTTGRYNTGIGSCALGNNTTGGFNIAIGDGALPSNTTGHGNMVFGFGSATYNTTGNHNVALGFTALFHNTTGCYNIAVGYRSMRYNCTGSYNVSIGMCSLACNTTGTNNIAIGHFAGTAVTVGYNNTLIGYSGACGTLCNTIGIQAGTNTLKVDHTGTLTVNGSPVGGASLDSTNSLFVGSHNTTNTGSSNIAQGYGALRNNTCGSKNVAIGYEALGLNTFGNYNIALGAGALSNNHTGHFNTAFGRAANTSNTFGCYNISLGDHALYSNTTGNCNVAIGSQALEGNTTGQENIAIGGQYTLRCNRTGSVNIAMGSRSLAYNCCGARNIGIGIAALQMNVSGCHNIAFGAGTQRQAGSNVTCGIAIGSYALYCNIGTDNIGIGVRVGMCCCITGNNNILIGAQATPLSGSCSNTITLGNGSIATIRAQVTSITALSDARDKTDIEALPIGLEFLRQVKPVKFTWNMRDGSKVGIKEAGFIAQDLQQLVNDTGVGEWLELTITNEDGSRIEATPGKLLPVMIKAIQELAAQNDASTQRITALEAAINK